MADEHKTETTANAGADTGTAKVFNQDEVDKILAQRLAREREKFADYEEIKKKAETLEAEAKKRAEAEMTELEKAKAELEAKNQAIADLSKDREWRTNWEKRETEAIEAEAKSLSEGQQAIVNALPLEQRRAAIKEFTLQGTPGPHGGKGGKGVDAPRGYAEEIAAAKTHKEIEAINRKYAGSF